MPVLLAELARDVHHQEQQVALAESAAHGVDHALGQERIGLMDAGGVEEDDLGIRKGEHALDGRAGGLGLVGDDGDLGADDLVQQRGFTGVGAAENGNKAGFHGATGCERRTRTCATRSSSLARTSMWMPSRSTDSPDCGTRPSHSLTNPPTVVDSISSSGWNSSRSPRRATSNLPETM